MTLNWTDEDLAPASQPEHLNLRAVIDGLAQQPGRWAEIATYPAERRKTAWTRGSTTCRRYPGLEYSVVEHGDGSVVLHFRIPATDV